MNTFKCHYWDPETGSEFIKEVTYEDVILNPNGHRMADVGLYLFNMERIKRGLNPYALNPKTGTYDEAKKSSEDS